jgi:carbon monoxide dehydrogenase subunit G
VQLDNSFTVPVPIDEAWRVLLDIERIAPCMPGAALDSVTGDDFTGRVKVKLGPINLTYQGKASFVEKDEAAHRAVIDAKGKDQRGNGTAAATVTATLNAEGAATRVDVVTDLNITGRPAQFGRGVMTDVGNKLLGQFADKLAAQLGEGDAPAQSAGPAKKAVATVAGAVEEQAAAAEASAGEGAPGRAVKKTAAATKKAAAAKATPAKAAPATAAPAGGAPAASDGAPAAADTAPIATDRAPAAKAPSGPPSGPTAPPNKPASSGPAKSGPSTVPIAPAPAVERRMAASDPEPIDLLEVAGGAAMARYAAPTAGVLAALLFILLVLRRRRG